MLDGKSGRARSGSPACDGEERVFDRGGGEAERGSWRESSGWRWGWIVEGMAARRSGGGTRAAVAAVAVTATSSWSGQGVAAVAGIDACGGSVSDSG